MHEDEWMPGWVNVCLTLFAVCSSARAPYVLVFGSLGQQSETRAGHACRWPGRDLGATDLSTEVGATSPGAEVL